MYLKIKNVVNFLIALSICLALLAIFQVVLNSNRITLETQKKILKNDEVFLSAQEKMKEKKYKESSDLFLELAQKSESKELRGYLEIKSAQSLFLDNKKDAIFNLRQISLDTSYPKTVRSLAVQNILSYFYKDKNLDQIIFKGNDFYETLKGSTTLDSYKNINSFAFSLYPLAPIALSECLYKVDTFEKGKDVKKEKLPSEVIELCKNSLIIAEKEIRVFKSNEYIGPDRYPFFLAEKARVEMKMNAYGQKLSDPLLSLDASIDASRVSGDKNSLLYALFIRAFYKRNYLKEDKNEVRPDLDEISLVLEDEPSFKLFVLNNFENRDDLRKDFFDISPNLKKILE